MEKTKKNLAELTFGELFVACLVTIIVLVTFGIAMLYFAYAISASF
jgi:hypothetical protein